MKNSSLNRRDSTANKAVWFFLFFFCWAPLFACQSRTTNIKDDLQKYLEHAKQWTAAEEQINNAVAVVRRDEFVHDDLITATLKPIIAVSREHVHVLEQYHPQTPPLVNVHQEYIEAWRSLSLAITAIVDAAAKKDYIQLAKAKNDLLEAQQSVSGALSDLARLLRETGLWKKSVKKSLSPAENH